MPAAPLCGRLSCRDDAPPFRDRRCYESDVIVINFSSIFASNKQRPRRIDHHRLVIYLGIIVTALSNTQPDLLGKWLRCCRAHHERLNHLTAAGHLGQ